MSHAPVMQQKEIEKDFERFLSFNTLRDVSLVVLLLSSGKIRMKKVDFLQKDLTVITLLNKISMKM